MRTNLIAQTNEDERKRIRLKIVQPLLADANGLCNDGLIRVLHQRSNKMTENQ